MSENATPFFERQKASISGAAAAPARIGEHQPEVPRPLPQSFSNEFIGPYRIIGPIGEGVMGRVYEAEQVHSRRRVAIKVINPADSTESKEELLRRFKAAIEILGRLNHPGITHVIEGGTAITASGEQPYYIMELIEKSEPITGYAERNRLDTRQRLDLMAQVCDAVAAAHSKFVIHLDLKPANILVDQEGTPKVLDFGVARLIDKDVQATDAGLITGTLAYTSPEQTLGNPHKVGTQSDVYALGAILYELLAGRRPYKLSHDINEALKIIREEIPAPLGTIDAKFRGDIEDIVATCLEKDKADRYTSPADIARDIRHYFNNEEITPRRGHKPKLSYRAGKFVRRNKIMVAGIAAVSIVLVGGVAVSTSQAVRANRERDKAITTAQQIAEDLTMRADVQRREAEDLRTLADVQRQDVLNALRKKDVALAGELDARQRETEQTRKAENAAREAEIQRALAKQRETEAKQNEVKANIASEEKDKETLKANIAKEAEEKERATAQQELATNLTGGIPGLVAEGKLEQALQNIARILAINPNVLAAKTWAFDLLLRGNLGSRVKPVDQTKGGAELFVHPPMQHSGIVYSASFSPNGLYVATASYDKSVRVWNGQTGNLEFQLDGNQNSLINSVAFNADGTRIVSATFDTMEVWDVSRKMKISTSPRVTAIVYAAFNKDGSKIVTAARSGDVQVWDAVSAKPIGTPLSHPSQVNFAAFSPNGTQLVTACDDKIARVWTLAGGAPLELRHEREVTSAMFSSSDGSRILTASRDGKARVWDAHTGILIKTIDAKLALSFAAFSPDGKRIATALLGTGGNAAQVWDAETGSPVTPPLHHSAALSSVMFSSDGNRIVTTSGDKTAQVWEVSYDFPNVKDLIQLVEAISGYDGSSNEKLSPEQISKRLGDVRANAFKQPPGQNNFIRWFFEHRL